MGTQLNSYLTSAVEQGALPLVTPGKKVDVPLEVVVQQPTLLSAIRLCINAAGLEDKQVWMQLDIDQGHFANITKGKGHFPPDKLTALMDICGNEAPLIWLAHRRGYGLVLLKSEAEKRAEIAEQRAVAAEEKLRYLEQLHTGRLK